MAPINLSVVSKGEYDNGTVLPRVYPKQYVILRDGKKNKFLSLRFYNGLEVSLTHVEFILFQLDSAGNVLKRSRIRENITRGIPEKTFALPCGIRLCEKCSDFKIVMVEARCGRYSYSLKSNNASAVYLLENKWKYNVDKQGFVSQQSVKSAMQGDFKLVKLLAAVLVLAVIAMCFSPIIKYISRALR